jgi:hypothetical protein
VAGNLASAFQEGFAINEKQTRVASGLTVVDIKTVRSSASMCRDGELRLTISDDQFGRVSPQAQQGQRKTRLQRESAKQAGDVEFLKLCRQDSRDQVEPKGSPVEIYRWQPGAS